MKKHYLILLIVLMPFSLFSEIVQKHHMVVSEHWLASSVGDAILRRGGNAIDAAVAIGYALAVVNPCCGNIGGGGFMTIHLATGKNIVINFREKAPLNAQQTMFIDKPRNAVLNGYLAVAVPGTVLGLDTALKKYGTLPRHVVMQPAIDLAANGFIVSQYLAKQLRSMTQSFQLKANVASIFLNHHRPFQAGDRLRQRELAHTLKQIAALGPHVFYKGEIARAIVNASKRGGGILSLSDFASYHIEILSPLYCTYHRYTIISAPPPSSGGVTLCEILNVLENFSLATLSVDSPERIRILVTALGIAFADRNAKLGDPDFVNNPLQKLLSKTYAASISKKIKKQFSLPVSKYTSTSEQFDTTHFSVVDSMGNAVALTYTLNGFFGAQVIAGHTGFFLNNELDDFALIPGAQNKFGLVQGNANSIQPGKRPLSSMTPTIVLKDNKVILILGSSGGPRIISAVLLTLLHVLDDRMNIQEAVDKERFHYQCLPNIIFIEPHALSSLAIKKLNAAGFRLKTQAPWGAVDAIYKPSANGGWHGANDKRRPDGAAIGA